jgi:hypothetical protein
MKSRDLKGFELTSESYTRYDFDYGAWDGFSWFIIIAVTVAVAVILNLVSLALAVMFVAAMAIWVFHDLPKQEIVTQTWVKKHD